MLKSFFCGIATKQTATLPQNFSCHDMPNTSRFSHSIPLIQSIRLSDPIAKAAGCYWCNYIRTSAFPFKWWPWCSRKYVEIHAWSLVNCDDCNIAFPFGPNHSAIKSLLAACNFRETRTKITTILMEMYSCLDLKLNRSKPHNLWQVS